MSDNYFRGDAQGRAQVTHLTPSNVEVGDVFTVTSNRKDISYTAKDSTIADVIGGLANAIGQFENTIPEFAIISARGHLDDNGDPDYLILTGLSDGTPFTVTSSTTNGTAFAVSVITAQEGAPPTNEIQRVRLSGPPTGGTFTLTFSGQTTSALAYNASAATVSAALVVLSNIASGDVSVTLNAASDWSIEFLQAYAGADVPLLTGDGTSLTGAATVSVTTTTQGDAGAHEVQTVTTVPSVLFPGGYYFRLFLSSHGYTGWIPWNATAAQVQFALEDASLNTSPAIHTTVIRTGNATDGYDFTVTFQDVGNFVQFTLYGGFLLSFTGTYFSSASDPSDPLIQFATIHNGDNAAISEVQVVTINNSPTGGTFTLTFQGQTTGAIAYNASNATVSAALVALSNIGATDVAVAGSSGGPYTVTFQNGLGGMDVQQMTGSGTNLTGSVVAATTSQESATGNNEQELFVLIGSPTAGTFTLTFNAETTGAIAFNATAATVQTALESLATPVPGDVFCTGGPLPDSPVIVEFSGAYAKTNVSAMTGDAAGLTGGGTQSLVTSANTVDPTGPHHWDNVENWSAGSLPIAGDRAFVANIGTDILWGLNGLSGVMLLEFHRMASHTGKFGLPPWNPTGFWEYRQLSADIHATKAFYGEGLGGGSSFTNINAGSVQTETIIYGTGRPDDTTLPAMLWKGTHASNVFRAFKGLIGVAMLVGEVATISTLQIGYLTDKASDVEFACGAGTTLATLQISGGSNVLSLEAANASSLAMTGGTLQINGNKGVSTTFVADGDAYIYWNTTGTLGGAPTLAGAATFDCSQDLRARVITNPIEVYSADVRIIDPFQTITGLVIDCNYVGVLVNGAELGTNVRLSRGTPA